MPEFLFILCRLFGGADNVLGGSAGWADAGFLPSLKMLCP